MGYRRVQWMLLLGAALAALAWILVRDQRPLAPHPPGASARPDGPPDSQPGHSGSEATSWDSAGAPAEEVRKDRPRLELRGRVTDIHGHPIARAFAEVDSGSTSGVSVVDPDGRFVLDVGLGDRVKVSAPGFAPLEWEARDEALPGPAEVRFVLRAARALRGRVVDDQREPVEGARVCLDACRQPGQSVTPSMRELWVSSGAGGIFVAPTVPRSPVRVRAEKEGHVGAGRVIFPGDERIPDLVLRRCGSVAIQVLIDGQPARDVSIGVRTTEGRTDFSSWPDGVVRLSLPPGSYRIAISVRGFLPGVVPVALAPGDSLEKTLSLEHGLTVFGRLLDPDGAPVGGARVRIYIMDDRDGLRDSVSNAAGSFAFTAVPAGTFEISVERKGWGWNLPVAPPVIEVFAGMGEAEIRLLERPPVEIDIGILFLDDGGAAAPLEDEARVRSAGEEESRRLPAGTALHHLRIPALPFYVSGGASGLPYEARFEAGPDDAGRTFEIRPLPSATIAGSVRDSAGHPVPEVLVDLSGSLPGNAIVQATERTGPDGSYRFPPLRLVRAGATAFLGGRVIGHRQIAPAAGENRCDFLLDGAGPIGPVDLVLVDALGLPVEGAEIRVEGEKYSGREPPFFSGPDGTVHVEGFGPGPRTLDVRIEAFRMRIPSVVPGTGPLRVTLPRIVELRGHVAGRFAKGGIYMAGEGEEFRLAGPCEGIFTIEIFAGRYRIFASGDDVLTEIARADAEGDIDPLVLVPAPSGRVRGLLAPSNAKRRIDGFSIAYRVSSGHYHGVCFEDWVRDGTFLSPALPPGPVSIEMDRPCVVRVSADVRAGEILDLGRVEARDPPP